MHTMPAGEAAAFIAGLFIVVVVINVVYKVKKFFEGGLRTFVQLRSNRTSNVRVNPNVPSVPVPVTQTRREADSNSIRNEYRNSLTQTEKGGVSIEQLSDFYNASSNNAKCAICLEITSPQFTMCLNGHLICTDCKKNLTTCPTCSEKFSEMKSSGLLKQILEDIPRPCPFSLCKQFFVWEDHHEDFCGYNPKKCMLCEWTGPGVEISGHILQNHSEIDVFTEKEAKLLLKNINLEREYSKIFPFRVFQHFFWLCLKNDLDAKLLRMKFQAVPSGKKNSVLCVQVELKSEHAESTTRIRLQNNLELSVDFNSSLVNTSVNNKNELVFDFKFTELVN